MTVGLLYPVSKRDVPASYFDSVGEILTFFYMPFRSRVSHFTLPSGCKGGAATDRVPTLESLPSSLEVRLAAFPFSLVLVKSTLSGLFYSSAALTTPCNVARPWVLLLALALNKQILTHP